MVSLKNFETQIPPQTLKRGEQYFRNGNVMSIENEGKGVWSAEVEGSETYTVEVTMKGEDKISDYSCDCPIGGGICKHVVAVLFTLRDQKNNITNKEVTGNKKGVFNSLLKSVTLNEYKKFVHQYASKNKSFKSEFELFFADKDSRIDVSKKYSELINKIIRKYSADGYIDYRSSFGLRTDIDKLLVKGEEYIAENNFRDAFNLVKAILKPVMITITYIDDSYGNIGSCIDNIIALLEKIISIDAVANNIKEEAFDFLKKELEDKDYFDYGDFGYDMFSLFQQLAIQLEKEPEFVSFANAQIEKLTGKYDDFRKEFFKMEVIAFFQQSGKTAEAEKLVLQNMDIVEVRMQVMNNAIRKKEYNKAKKIIAEGIKIAESKSHPGTVNQWIKELLRIANLENDITAIRNFTKYFAFERGVSPEYYKQWKKTFTATEWNQVIENHIAETIQKITVEWNKSKNKFWNASPHPPLLDTVGQIYILENFWDRLLVLVQQANNLNTTLEYHQYLVKNYSSALLEIYIPALEAFGVKANGRDEYADLVRKMKKIINEIPEGKEDVLAVAKHLRDRFSVKPRRPAMIEELDKILK